MHAIFFVFLAYPTISPALSGDARFGRFEEKHALVSMSTYTQIPNLQRKYLSAFPVLASRSQRFPFWTVPPLPVLER